MKALSARSALCALGCDANVRRARVPASAPGRDCMDCLGRVGDPCGEWPTHASVRHAQVTRRVRAREFCVFGTPVGLCGESSGLGGEWGLPGTAMRRSVTTC
jgi:hypothetical protein